MNEKFFDLKSEKQDRIINAALYLFAVNGYKHASTDEMVRTAGISKGLLFHYFGSKAGLYAYLVDFSVKYMLYEFKRVIGEETDYFDYNDRLELAKANVLGTYPYMNIFVQNALTADDVSDDLLISEAIASYTATMKEYSSRLVRPSFAAGVDAGKVDKLITYTSRGLTEEFLTTGSMRAEDLYKQISEYLKMIRTMTVA